MVNVRLPRTSRGLYTFARIAAAIVSRDKREARRAALRETLRSIAAVRREIGRVNVRLM
jgi:hypothetical protein